MIKIKIIRHSERLDYTHPFYWLLCIGHYWSDTPLTDNGYKMANLKGKELSLEENFHPKHICTSPYVRTMSTSTEIQHSFPQSKIIIEPLLSETQLMWKHRVNLYPNGIPTMFDGKETDFSYPESTENFSRRVLFVINGLLTKYSDDFIIVTHGEVLKVFANHIQKLYPDCLLDVGDVPYLTTISFSYDKNQEIILEEGISVSI